MFYKNIHFLLFILGVGVAQIVGLDAQVINNNRCTQVGIYPGDNPREFIVCTRNGATNGNQLILTKHTCSDNTMFKDRKCIPITIVPYSSSAIAGDNSQQMTKQKDMSVKCKTDGLFCTSCKELSLCVGDENDDGTMKYHGIKMMDCAEGEICVPAKGCSQPNFVDNFCPYSQFQCSDLGIFPDPFDCQVYYHCTGSSEPDKYKQTRYKCSTGSFNSETNSCYYPMNSSSCLTSPVPICKTRFQMGPLQDNLHQYYICFPNYEDHTLTPSLYNCPSGLKFDIKTLSCS